VIVTTEVTADWLIGRLAGGREQGRDEGYVWQIMDRDAHGVQSKE